MDRSFALLAVHVFMSAVFFASLYYDFLYCEGTLVHAPFAGKWKYLTHINMWIQAFYFLLCAISGVKRYFFHVAKRKDSLTGWIDHIHASVAFPAGMFVTIAFWAIYAVDRELVYPKWIDEIIPMWLNHVFHTIHPVFLITDKVLVYHKYPSQLAGISTALFFMFSYQTWVLYLALYVDIWVYPILEKLSWTYRGVFFAVLWAFLLLLYHAGAIITNKLWGRHPQTAAKKLK